MINGLPKEYAQALTAVLETCRLVVEINLDLRLPDLNVIYAQVDTDRECIRTDYQDTIFFEFSSVDRLKPPPVGFRCIYGTCHEVGHMVLARLLPPACIPPVVWDEAIAHYLAVHLFVPEVWREHGAELWPDPYPNYNLLEGEEILSAGPVGHLGGYEASLRTLTAQLTSYVECAGLSSLRYRLTRLTPNDMKVTAFGPALRG